MSFVTLLMHRHRLLSHTPRWFRCVNVTHTPVFMSTTSKMSHLEPHKPDGRSFTLIYRFPGMPLLRAVSRLKLLQTGVTLALLPPVWYLYLQGAVSHALLTYSTVIAGAAALMLYLLSYFLRRVVGMMYLDAARRTLKVSHLTFWGRRRDLYMPVTDVMMLSDTGDSRTETLLRLKRYSCKHTLYFSTRLGRVTDAQAFTHVFGHFH